MHSFAESLITSFSRFESFQGFVNWAFLLLVSHSRSQFKNLPRNFYWYTATDHGRTILTKAGEKNSESECLKCFEKFKEFFKANLEKVVT